MGEGARSFEGRYWLFAGSDYYPFGGMQDFKYSKASVEEIIRELDNDPYGGSQWLQIWDSEKHKIVAYSCDQSFLDDLEAENVTEFQYDYDEQKWEKKDGRA
jgi:hypothetical protein